MKLIDKDAVVAEIERYKRKADERLKIKGRTLAEDCKDSALQNLCGNLLHFIDTLEVKKVIAEQEGICNGIFNRIIGNNCNLSIPLDKVGLKHGDKVKIFITKENKL